MSEEKIKPKFEARPKGNSKYGVWNNNMYSWQYILVLDAYETETFTQAEKYAEALNQLQSK